MQSSVTALEQHLAELLEVTQPETATEANMLRGEMEYHCALMRNYLTEMASGIAATRTERAWASQD